MEYLSFITEVLTFLWLKLKQWLKRRKRKKVLSIVITEEKE